MKKSYILLASTFILLAFFTTTSAQIVTTLKPGDKSTQVTLLQKILNSIGKSVAPSGPGSKGQETDEFGPSTASAVKAFQCERGIVCSGTPGTTGWGAVGPKTRALLNSLGSSIAGFFSNIEGRSQLAGGIGDGTDSSLIYYNTFDGESTPGKIGNAKTFNGTSDYIDIPASAALNGVSTGVAISAWVNFASPNTGTWQIIAAKLDKAGTNDYPYFQYMLGTYQGTYKPRFFATIGNNVVNDIVSSKAVTAGGWHHLVGTYDKQYMKVYVDGVLRGSLAKSANIVFRDSVLRIGAGGVGTEFFKGALDDLRIYNRGLTASEVSELYALGSGGTTPPVNGACDSRTNGQTVSSAPTTNLCSAGTASAVSPLVGNTYSWTCAGTGTGATTASCTATQAVIQNTYTLNVTKTGTGSGTVSGGTITNCNGTCTQASIPAGTTITLTASPATNTSVAWSGCTTSTGNTCAVTLNNANAYVTATFTTNAVRVDGTCGPAQKSYTATESFPSGALCSTGTASAVSPVGGPIGGGTASWTCLGSTAPAPVGTTATCSASRAAIILTNPSITSFTATPSSVATGGTSLLKWSTTNATACTGVGFSTGVNNATSNTAGVSVSLTATTTYTLNCTGLAGTTAASQNVTVTVSANPAPTATISASPSSITSGQTSTITWSSTNATSCTASGGWTGAKATFGTQSVSPTVNTTYSITCTGAGGTTPVQSATVNVGTTASDLPSGNGLAKALDPITGAYLYPGDAGIANNSNVLWSDNFESYDVSTYATCALNALCTSGAPYKNAYGDIAIVSGAGTGSKNDGEVFTGSKALKFKLPVVTNNGESSNAIHKSIPGQDVVFARVYTKFSPGFSVAGQGHNGLRVMASYDGSGIRPNGTNHYMADVENSKYLSGETDPGFLHSYVYHMDQVDAYGDHLYPSGEIRPTGGPAISYVTSTKTNINMLANEQTDQWHSYEIMLKANTPGQRDGRVAFWIDGTLVGDFTNLRFRTTDTLKIDEVVAELHSHDNPSIDYKWYDNLVIAKQYIGPMAPPVVGQTNPTASLSASPSSITSGGSSTLTWSSTNATGGCVGTGFSTGGATSGSQSVSPTATTAYTIQCSGAAGTTPASQSVTVTVGTVTNPPSTTFTVGDRVYVNNTGVQTRPAPGTNNTPVGSHTTNDLGTIVTATDNGVSANGFYWWKVNFDSGADGYVAENFLTKVTTTGTAVLTVNRTGSSAGTVSVVSPAGTTLTCGNPNCSTTVNVGTVVTLSAAPISGATFTGWSGACSGTGNCVVTVNAATTVTAQFDTTGGAGVTTVTTCSAMIDAVNSRTSGSPTYRTINVTSDVTSCNVGTLTVSGQSLIGPGAANGVGGTEISGKITLQKDASKVTRVEGFRFSQGGNQITVSGASSARAYVLGKSYINSSGSNEFIHFLANGGLIYSNHFYTAPSGSGGPDQMQIKYVGEDWSQPPTFGNRDTQGPNGGERNIYFENNTFENILETAPDGDDGARIVIRGNTYKDSSIVFHGGRNTDTSDFGTRQFEIYNNTFDRSNTTDNVSKWIWVRGGTGVIANNYIDDDTGVPYGLTSIKLGVGCPDPYPVKRQIGQAYDTVETPPSLPLLIFGNTGPGATDISRGENGTGGGGATNCSNPDNYVKVNRDYYLSNQWNWQPFTYTYNNQATTTHPLRFAINY